jgi:RNA polymerase primary sigma factor
MKHSGRSARRQAHSPLHSYDDGRRQKHINEWLSQLPDTERKVIELRYGLNREDSHTLMHIGKQFGLTRERIRQIENKAIERLKKLTNQKHGIE